MRIVIIPSADLSYNSGSVIYAKRLFSFLLNAKHDVYMLSNCIPNDLSSEEQQHIIVKEHLLFHPIIDDREVSDNMYYLMCRDILDAISFVVNTYGKIDIIHAHYASINSYAANIAYNLFHIPYIISSFGRDVSIGYHCDSRIRKFITRSYDQAASIIVPDIGIQQLALRTIGIHHSSKLRVIPMPVDNSIYKQGQLDDVAIKSKGSIVISSINSCFTKEKGIETILEAISAISKKYDVYLVIAGDDDDENKKNYTSLLALTNHLKLQNRVEFIGYLSREDVGTLLKATDIFVDARTQGHFSSVLIEAQIMGAVTIASNNSSSQKIIDQGNGLLFEQGDSQSLSSQIVSLIENPELYNSIKQSTIRWAATEGIAYQEDRCFNEIVEVYLSATEFA